MHSKDLKFVYANRYASVILNKSSGECTMQFTNAGCYCLRVIQEVILIASVWLHTTPNTASLLLLQNDRIYGDGHVEMTYLVEQILSKITAICLSPRCKRCSPEMHFGLGYI